MRPTSLALDDKRSSAERRWAGRPSTPANNAVSSITESFGGAFICWNVRTVRNVSTESPDEKRALPLVGKT